MNHPDGWQNEILPRHGATWREIFDDFGLNAGLSQEDLAAAAKTRQALVSAIEIGTANPTLSSLEKLASALGASLTELFR